MAWLRARLFSLPRYSVDKSPHTFKLGYRLTGFLNLNVGFQFDNPVGLLFSTLS